jgi:hypothetical protein
LFSSVFVFSKQLYYANQSVCGTGLVGLLCGGNYPLPEERTVVFGGFAVRALLALRFVHDWMGMRARLSSVPLI